MSCNACPVTSPFLSHVTQDLCRCLPMHPCMAALAPHQARPPLTCKPHPLDIAFSPSRLHPACTPPLYYYPHPSQPLCPSLRSAPTTCPAPCVACSPPSLLLLCSLLPLRLLSSSLSVSAEQHSHLPCPAAPCAPNYWSPNSFLLNHLTRFSFSPFVLHSREASTSRPKRKTAPH